ncbi:MAG: DUF2905 domain-containing protein [Planctomycetota bacterium]
MNIIGKTLSLVGAICMVVGLLIWTASNIPFVGNLPGDIHYESDGTEIVIPLTTCLLASLLLTFVFNLFLRLRGN